MAEEKKGRGILDIKEVPHSPHTGNSPTRLYNPTDEDFEFRCEGIPFVVPAKGFLNEAEYRVFHGAKHLAEKIVMQKHNLLFCQTLCEFCHSLTDNYKGRNRKRLLKM